MSACVCLFVRLFVYSCDCVFYLCVCVNSCISRSAIVCCMFVILLHVYDGAQSHVPHACSCTQCCFWHEV